MTRLTQRAQNPVMWQPPAAEVFARWQTDPPIAMWTAPRPAAHAAGLRASPVLRAGALVTCDNHPRSVLDELPPRDCPDWDAEQDQVVLTRNAFVPNDAQAAMLGFLWDNKR